MNEDRFTGRADVYKKYRSSYPRELIDYLYTEVGFSPESVVADIGSGTGIFSRLLLERGSRVTCVEPNEDMRRTAERDLTEAFPHFVSLEASAESTGLADKSMNFVTVAQAFHWFDRPLFHGECRRILKDGGQVVLVWNVRDYEHEMIQKDLTIRETYAIDTKGFAYAGGPPPDRADFFANGVCAEKTFRNDMLMDRETYVGTNLSRSYSPREDQHPEKYRGLVAALRALFDEYQKHGVIHFPQYTQVFYGRV